MGTIQGLVPRSERYIVTDCDVIPDESCPFDWVETLEFLLDKHPNRVKIGLGLRTDDLTRALPAPT